MIINNIDWISAMKSFDWLLSILTAEKEQIWNTVSNVLQQIQQIEKRHVKETTQDEFFSGF